MWTEPLVHGQPALLHQPSRPEPDLHAGLYDRSLPRCPLLLSGRRRHGSGGEPNLLAHANALSSARRKRIVSSHATRSIAAALKRRLASTFPPKLSSRSPRRPAEGAFAAASRSPRPPKMVNRKTRDSPSTSTACVARAPPSCGSGARTCQDPLAWGRNERCVYCTRCFGSETCKNRSISTSRRWG